MKFEIEEIVELEDNSTTPPTIDPDHVEIRARLEDGRIAITSAPKGDVPSYRKAIDAMLESTGINAQYIKDMTPPAAEEA